MTGMTEGHRPGGQTGRRAARWVPAALPWLLLAILVLVVTANGPAGWGETLAYQGYAAAAVAVPGTVAKRLLAGAGSVLEDLGIGFALGATGQLVLWALHQWLGGPAWALWTGPAAVVALLVLPSVRGRVLDSSAGAPVWFHWALAGLTGLGTVSLVNTFSLLAPPLEENQYVYQDLWYHLALNNEMLRAFPLITPDAAGVPLAYHWYSNAFMAAGHLMTGVDLYGILMRQWLLPMFLACMLGTVALARQVSSSWHVAWVAPTLAFAAPASFRLFDEPTSPADVGFLPESPSTILGLVMVLAVAALALQLWRSAGDRRSAVGLWAALVVVVAGSTGAKPTVLPLLGFLAGGWVLASFLVRQGGAGRRISWNGLAVGLLAVVATGAGSGIVSDAESGSVVQLGGFLRFMPGFPEMSGLPWGASPGVIHPAILAGGDQTRAVLVAVGWLLLVQAWHWLPALALPARHLRGDPAGWALLAAVAGSWAVFAVLDHPGFSQVYFPRTVIPLAAVLAGWVVVETASLSRAALVSVLAAAAAGSVVVAVAWHPASPEPGKGSHVIALATALLVVVLSGLVIWAVQRWRVGRAAARAPLAVLVLAGVVAGSMLLPVRDRIVYAADLVRQGAPAPIVDPDSRFHLSTAELEAAVWLREHADPYDVVASATLCTPATGVAPNCRGDQFWITGISGLRMLMAGWYYLPIGPPELAGDGSVERRTELSQRLVAEPDQATVDAAVEEFGVDWVFADRTTGPVSADLQQYGTVAYDNGTVLVVRLRD